MSDIAPEPGDAIKFDELPLSAAVLRGLAEAGFVRPSPIQSRAIPLGRFGVDMIAQAKSGTGKTLVFVTIALELVSPSQPSPQVLIVSPTREIALQSRNVCRVLGSHVRGLCCNAFVGGTPMKSDVSLASSSQVACGTPGRLVGLLLCEALVASRVRLLVLDEADKLCDQGFEPQLRYMLTALPERKQSLAFSATYPPALLAALKSSMRSPLTVSLLPRGAEGTGNFSASSESDASDPLSLLERAETLGAGATGICEAHTGGDAGSHVSSASAALGSHASLVGAAALQGVVQCYQLVYTHDGSGESRLRRKSGASLVTAKQREALRLLDTLTFHQAIIFCNVPEVVTRLTEELNASGFPAAAISGQHTQTERTAVIERMRAFHLRVLVATDLIARGVDLNRVTLILHIGLPHDLTTYLHRVGRTGRFATRGLSVLLLGKAELRMAQRMLRPLNATVSPLPLHLPEAAYLPEQAAPPDAAALSDAAARMRIDASDSGESEGQLKPQKARVKSKATPQQAWIPTSVSTPDAAIPTAVTAAPAGTMAAAPSARESLASDGKSACEHASADALERARERGRQRGLAQARQRAHIRYGLEPDAYDREPPTPPHERQVEWWEGLLAPE